LLKRNNGPGASVTPTNPNGTTPNALANRGDEDDNVPYQDSVGFLRLISPKKEFFVGELVPVELKAFFRAGMELRLEGLPKLNSDAFAMNKLGDQPARSQQMIDGVPYSVFTWSTAITAVKAGDYEMSLEIPTTVTVHHRAQRSRARTSNPTGDPFFDGFFNDSFFDNFFGTTTEKQVALNSRPMTVKILSLPLGNRPSGFAGAVGNFDIAAEAVPAETAAGDPVTLKLKVTGSGNFDRVTAPALEKNNAWKIYKPTAKFEPEDDSACSGAKTFEQALVPTRSGKLEIPALAFSFFDPEKHQYVTRTTTPLTIKVASGQVPSGQTGSPSVATSAAELFPEPKGPAPIPNKPSRIRFISTIRPWLLNPWIPAGAFLLAILVFATHRLIRRRQPYVGRSRNHSRSDPKQHNKTPRYRPHGSTSLEMTRLSIV